MIFLIMMNLYTKNVIAESKVTKKSYSSSLVIDTKAFKASFYPGMEQISSTNVVFESDNYFEILRMLLFVV